MNADTAIVNIPLAKRGNIDAQIDAYKRQQAALERAETVELNRASVRHLCKGGFPRVYANRTQAQAAAVRTGGEAYQSITSGRFLVRFA